MESGNFWLEKKGHFIFISDDFRFLNSWELSLSNGEVSQFKEKGTIQISGSWDILGGVIVVSNFSKKIERNEHCWRAQLF